jgi:hypothetical protein
MPVNITNTTTTVCAVLTVAAFANAQWSDITHGGIAGQDGDGTMGISFVDIDSDGDDDLVIANGTMTGTGGPTRLFINDGNGNFTEGTFGPFAENHRVWQTIFGDMDNDGDPDMFWVCFGEQCRLFENVNGGTLFLEIDGPWVHFCDNPDDPDDFSDCPGDTQGNLMARGGAWVDYDMDGLLDIMISTNGSSGYIGSNKLYRNERDPVTGEMHFVEKTPDAWLPQGDEEGIIGRGVAWCDFDNDGDPDLYAVGGKGCKCNGDDIPDDWWEYAKNRMWRNDGLDKSGEIIFTEVMIDPDWDGDGKLDQTRHGRGVAAGDYDNDGDIDLYICNVGLDFDVESYVGPNRLLENKLIDNGVKDPKNAFVFEDVTPTSLNLPGGERSPAWFDMDNDGDLDLAITVMWNECPNLAVYENTGGDSFVRVDDDNFCQEDQIGASGMGLAIADIDDDGDLDVATTWKFGKNLFLGNDLDNENHWIKIELEGTTSNRSAVGARVEIISGELTQIRELVTGSGYWSQHSMVQHVGLGDRTSIDEIVVRWPSGNIQHVFPTCIDRTIRIVEMEPQCPADLNADCNVDVSDILELLGYWGNCNGCAADVNNDGTLDVTDLLIIIDAWGDCS